MKLIDETGKRYGRLLVVGFQNGKWECKCDCGKVTYVLGGNLRSGRQKSCGCLDYERKVKHGNTSGSKETPEYRAWKNMKKRCYNTKDKYYQDYGGRGIKVCDRWLHSFENFLEDMGKRPSPKHSLDRIDYNGDYSPENCRWVTASEQIINQRLRKDNKSGYKGVTWEKRRKQWYVYIKPGSNMKRIYVGAFDNLEDAIEARKQAEIKYRQNRALAE